MEATGELDSFWKTVLWQQLGAAIDMLENAMRACPDKVWSDPAKKPQWPDNDIVGFWYIAFHTLFFLDLYLTASPREFTPPAPFNLDELAPDGLLPERPYTKEELQTYLEFCRRKCRNVIATLTDERARRSCGVEWLDLSVAELLLYNMRHVQHHAAQLNLVLRQEIQSAPKWVRKTKIALSGPYAAP